MPYFPAPPATPIHDTEFPHAWDPDVQQQIQMIEELFKSQKPTVFYEQILKGNVVIGDMNTPTGTPGTTYFDGMWGEDVDASYAAANGKWIQPHMSGVAKAADVDVFSPIIEIKGDPVLIDTDEKLKKFGVDSRRARIGHLLVFIPLSLLDAGGLISRMGDRIAWDGDKWSVIEAMLVRPWNNTNIRLYMRLVCVHYRHGS